VAELILKEHYYGKPAQERIEANAKAVDRLMSPISMVVQTNESGDAMNDVLSSSIRTGQTDLVQRYGRYYSLAIVRWLADLFSELCHLASSERDNVGAFYGAWEYFRTYRVDDSFLRSRKKWPLG
jgi:hypothetical protein